MEEIRVIRREGSLVPIDVDSEQKLLSLPAGASLKAKITRSRSKAHNAFFHVVMKEAFEAWPQDHRFQPNDEKHLRAWLLCMAGHCSKIEIKLNSEQIGLVVPIIQAFQTWFGEDKERYIWCDIRGTKIIATRPLSLKYEDVDQLWFTPIAERVFDILATEIEFDADEHHQEWQARNNRSAQGDNNAKEKKPVGETEGEDFI